MDSLFGFASHRCQLTAMSTSNRQAEMVCEEEEEDGYNSNQTVRMSKIRYKRILDQVQSMKILTLRGWLLSNHVKVFK